MEKEKNKITALAKGVGQELTRSRHSIWDTLKGKLVLTKEETTIAGIISGILEDKDTRKMTPYTGEVYLINDKLKYKVKLGRKNRLWIIVNDENSIVKDCTLDFSEHLKRLINESILKDMEVFDQLTEESDQKVLDKIAKKVPSMSVAE
jgi:hypothetical protein